MRSLRQVANSIFHLQEYRVDGEPVARFLKWTLLNTPFFRVFFHKFTGPDWSIDPHDHPSGFVSIGLKGSYVEVVYDRTGKVVREAKWNAPWIRYFPSSHIHRMSWVDPRGTYTLCLVSRWNRDWGYVVEGKMLTYREYIRRYRTTRAHRPGPQPEPRPADVTHTP
jgi:hypothetical protein